MSDKLLQLFHKHDRYKFSKPNMARCLSDLFPVEHDKLFDSDKVERVVNDILDFKVNDSIIYNADECAKLCVSLSDEVRKTVKELDFKRYKLVCLVQIFEKRNQSISSVARVLCDTDRDRYVVVRRENNHVYLIISVYGIFYP